MVKRKRDNKGKFIPLQSNIVSDEIRIPNHSGQLDAGTFSLTNGSVLFMLDRKITEDNSNLFWNDVNKRLGVKTNNPLANLDIAGTTRLGGQTHTADDQGEVNLFGDGSNAQSGAFHSKLRIWGGSGQSRRLELYFVNSDEAYINSNFQNLNIRATGTGGGIKFTTVNKTDAVVFDVDGNVGIGTDSPNTKLHLVSTTSGGAEIRTEDIAPRITWIDTNAAANSGWWDILGASNKLQYRAVNDAASAATIYMEVLRSGINITSVTFPVGDINTIKNKITAIGGICIKLTNKTGANSVAGEVVITDSTNDDSVVLAGTAEVQPIGVFLDSGVSDGSEAWIVISGIADVKADTAGFTRGDRLVTSLAAATVARATTNNAPAVAVHFQEIGHALETAAGNALGRCVLHFN